MSGRWKDTLPPAGTEELLDAVRGHRLAEIRRSRGLTQHHLAEKMGVSQSHVYEIERGSIAEREALAHYAMALGGRLRQTIHFDDGDISVVE
ncbi:helix-turn-helix transcriptional regulator [Amycolatopsis acidicola]|uniref:Helix-turn-helix transcriptional regulator n=1 Tax=Amycolatopsis acidicola TaxID=2596893 RepID=A0A5N0UTN6_9PSEU|nr:helix-turn-helix transcriptional regulator [Amycolatopsis acidicola]KAA9153338.1 helix-turn-helix transcriptional regulator [Amycolatopsis acidicola]